MKYGFVYIMSHTEKKGKIKIGESIDPDERAKTLTNSSGNTGVYVVEWKAEVPDKDFAEKILHYKFKEHHHQKEFFTFPVKEAIKISEEIIPPLFKDHTAAERVWIKNSRKEFLNKLYAGNTKKEYDKKIKLWNQHVKLLEPSFVAKAIKLCIKEGKIGDPQRSRIISFRGNHNGLQSIHLFFRNEFIKIDVTAQESQRVIIEGAFPMKKFGDIELKRWAKGFTFKIKTEEQFKKLVLWLGLGKKRN